MKSKYYNQKILLCRVVLILGVLLGIGCQSMNIVEPEENPLQDAIADALVHLSSSSFVDVSFSTSMDTNNPASDISGLHTAYNVTNVGTNAGYLWFNLDEDKVDTVVMKNRSMVMVEVLNSFGSNVDIEASGVVTNDVDYQVFEGANGPWYLRMSFTNTSILM